MAKLQISLQPENLIWSCLRKEYYTLLRPFEKNIIDISKFLNEIQSILITNKAGAIKSVPFLFSCENI